LAKLLCKNSKFLALNAQANASNTGYHTIQKYKGVNCVVINETELRQELRDKNEKLDILTKKLTKMIGINNLVITRGSMVPYYIVQRIKNIFIALLLHQKLSIKLAQVIQCCLLCLF
jgi:sugar/nucleoside kinase (ribokinase family)